MSVVSLVAGSFRSSLEAGGARAGVPARASGALFPDLSPFPSLSDQKSNYYIKQTSLKARHPHCAAWKVRMAQQEDGVVGRVFVWQRS